MKVLLFRAKPHKETIGLQNVMICEPLELEYVAAYIEKFGHEAIIVDMILERKPISYFVRLHNPDVVGFSGYISHVNILRNYAREVKLTNPRIYTIIGGVHAEVNPEDFESPYVDFIIRANPLKTFEAILERLQSGAEDSANFGASADATDSANFGENAGAPLAASSEFDDIDCIYRANKTPPVKETTFDYPFPARDKVNKYRAKYYYMFHRNCSLIKTSFGCPYNCKFCFCRQITDDKYFVRDLDNIVAELESIPETEIYIVDDDFLFNRDRLLDFCDRLKQHNVHKKYLVYGRADFIAANEDVIAALKEVGLRAVIVGLESCDSRQLDDYNKRTNVEINEKACAILHKYDVECYGTFILGLDWKWADFKALLRWIKKLGLVFVNLQPLTPLRGTEMYEAYKDRFIVREDEYEKWDLAHLVVKPTYISPRKYYWYTIVLYYLVTVNPKSAIYMIRKYGLHDTLKLSFGAALVSHQYFMKLIKGK